MASYWSSDTVPGTSSIRLVEGMRVLAQLSSGDKKVLGIVSVSGVDDDGNAVGTVVDYMPKNVPTIEDVFYTYLQKKDVLETLSPKTNQLVIHYVDRQGVPWSIQAYHAPKVITGEDVVATSPSYLDKAGRLLKINAFTLDDAVAAIDGLKVFRQKPDLSVIDRYQVGIYPETISDRMGGEWLVYKLDDPERGAVGFYAAPNIYGMPIVVGPCKSLAELARDVKSYVARSGAIAAPRTDYAGGRASATDSGSASGATQTIGVSADDVAAAEPAAASGAAAVESAGGGAGGEGAGEVKPSPWPWILIGLGTLAAWGASQKK